MAANRLKSLASRALGLWRVVKLFRDVGHRGIPATTDHVREQTARILEALDPVTRMVSQINEPGYADKVLAETTGAAATAAASAIEKSSIVLGHSILDEVLTECCHISAQLMPESWMGFVQDRKIPLSEALRTPAADIGQQLLGSYLDQLGRESMRKRVDILNERYQPAPAFEYEGKPYKFDRDRLETIDLQRQDIIHRLDLSPKEKNGESDDLLYLEQSCFYFIYILAHKHGIAFDPLSEAIDHLGSKKTSPVQLAYEGLLLATSLPTAEEQIWSAGGSVFASNNRRSRQLPLFMPAATPDLSSDHRRIVFVKYRQKSGETPEGMRSHIGDIWISSVDGSDAELVLEGGPRPGLIPPVEGFPQELEGITSPKFDPDAQRVYFIADAWTTSNAVYVLDLKIRDVRFLAPGNGFVILHGEPHRGSLLVSQHRYYGPPNGGSFDHLWLISPTGEAGDDFGDDLDAALTKLYGPGGRKLAFPHL